MDSSASKRWLRAPLRPRMLVRAGLAVLAAAAAGSLAGLWSTPDVVARLPELCLFHGLTGFDCPGCGMGRALALLAAGQVSAAGRQHAFVVPFVTWMALWGMLPERLYAYAIERSRLLRTGLPAAACATLLVWWLGTRVL